MNIFGTTFNYEERLRKVKKLMAQQDIDCLLVHSFVNQHYISGFYHHLPWYPDCHSFATEAPVILFREGDPIFLCAFLIFNAVKEGTWIKDMRVIDRESNLRVNEFVAQVLKEKKLEAGKIGIEGECCTYSTSQELQALLPKAKFKNASDVFYFARVVKEPEEIKLIKEAVAIGEAGMKVAMETAKPGVTEMEVQRAAELEMKRRGGFREVETMCQSGVRTANYRAFASEWKKIENNELVMSDLGVVYKGYGCDITRTWVVGKPTDEQKKIANDLYKVHEKILSFMKPGLKYYEVHDFVREELTRLGYPLNKRAFPCQQFSLHGLGLGPFHDPPDVEHKEIVLEAGMALSVQPSVRQEKYTIRFEDDVILTPGGLEMVSKLPKELI